MAGGAQAVQWGSLPDELWVKTFGGVDFAERHRSLALVCRRWAELVHTPALLADVKFGVANWQPILPRLSAFCAWLSRRATRHARALALYLDVDEVEQWDEILALLVASVMACSASGQLQELTWQICNHADPLPLSWLAALTSLTRLEMPEGNGMLDVCGSLDHLTNLQKLVLAGWGVAESVSLHQLASLSRLEQLTVVDTDVSASSYACLRQLSRMTKLSLVACGSLPDSLGELTWLRHLEMVNTPDMPFNINPALVGGAAWPDQLQEALAPLTRLKHLVLHELNYFPFWPAAIAGMAELHTLVAETVEPDALLPVGPYLRSLRHLHLPAAAVALNAATLNFAAQLETLELSGLKAASATSSQELEAVRWAGRCPRLRQLRLHVYGDVSRSLLNAVVAAQRANPALHIMCE